MFKRVYFIIFLLTSLTLNSLERDFYEVQFKTKGVELKLNSLPQSSYRDDILEMVKDMEPQLLVETKFRMTQVPEKHRLDLVNSLIAVSGLEGVEYYSRSSKKVKTLFSSAYSIDNNGDKIPDLEFTEGETKKSGSIFLDDASFGPLNYKSLFYNISDSYGMVLENSSKMTYMLITLANPGDIKLIYQVIPGEDGFDLYGIALCRVKVPFFMKDVFSESLYNMILAIMEWYAEGLTK